MKSIILFLLISVLIISNCFGLKEIDFNKISKNQSFKNRFEIAMYNYSTGKFSKALTQFNSLHNDSMEKSAIKENSLYWSGIIYLKLQEFDLALTYFNKYITISKYKEYYLPSVMNLGQISFQKKQYEKAIQYFTTTLLFFDTEKFKSFIYYQLGNCYLHQSKLTLAYETYKVVTTHYPDSFENDKAWDKINFLKSRITIQKPKKQLISSRKINKNIQVSKKNNKYVVQTGVFKYKKGAETLKMKLRKHNLPSYIVKDKGLYKVRIGFFNTKKEALNFIEKKLNPRKFEGIIISIG